MGRSANVRRAWEQPMTDEPDGFELVPEPDGFTRAEADQIIKTYVCPICHGQLLAFPMFDLDGDKYGYPLEVVVCSEHGNVEHIGRVSINSVSIQFDEARYHFAKVIRNLADLWGVLIPPKKTADEIIKELGF
jgi:hypothetical protein